MRWDQNSPSSQQPWPHGLETERRLTTLELKSDAHSEKIKSHEDRHDAQDAWNKGFTIALAGLSSGLMHAKAGDLIEWGIALLKVWKP